MPSIQKMFGLLGLITGMYSSITLISFAIIILICYVLDKISVFSAILFILVSMVTNQSAYYMVLLRLLYSLSIVLSENVWFIGPISEYHGNLSYFIQEMIK